MGGVERNLEGAGPRAQGAAIERLIVVAEPCGPGTPAGDKARETPPVETEKDDALRQQDAIGRAHEHGDGEGSATAACPDELAACAKRGADGRDRPRSLKCVAERLG